MIDINLIPDASRKKKKPRGPVSVAAALSRETIIAFSGGTLLLLIVLHVVLQGIIVSQYVQYHQRQKDMAELQGQKDNVDRTIQQLKGLQAEMKSLAALDQGVSFSWAQKLYEISRLLPKGVWLSRIEFQGPQITIQGSSVNKSGSEMAGGHRFLAQLKESPEFMTGFTQIELGLMKSRRINTTTVADFTITITCAGEGLKTNSPKP